jgi:3-hydroxyacyl-[acyl-carrier-protein] dehydratase
MTGTVTPTGPSGRVILEALRQRPPFLFIDTLDPAPQPAAAVAHYTFPSEAPYFAGHFPGDPVVPGVLLVEAMAQAARCALYQYLGVSTPGYLVGVDGCRFQQLVRPGEPLTLRATLGDAAALAAWAGTTMKMVDARCAVFRSGKRVARARVTLHIEALPGLRSETSDTETKSKGAEP